jgi:hypothetical protein
MRQPLPFTLPNPTDVIYPVRIMGGEIVLGSGSIESNASGWKLYSNGTVEIAGFTASGAAIFSSTVTVGGVATFNSSAIFNSTVSFNDTAIVDSLLYVDAGGFITVSSGAIALVAAGAELNIAGDLVLVAPDTTEYTVSVANDGQLKTDASEEWTAWTPTYTGLTVGNGAVVARYRVVGRTMFFHWQIVCGTTTVIGTNPKVVIPPGWLVHNASQLYVINPAMAFDSSAGVFHSGIAGAFDSSDNVLSTRFVFNTSTVTATAPFTWASGDVLAFSGTVEVEPA